MIDRVVLLGFGGPESREEVRPFLDRVLQGRPVPPERYEEVVQHYEEIGGKSPFNELTQRQAGALRGKLRERGMDVPVLVAYRNAAPFIDDVAAQVQRAGGRTCAIVLAAHQSEVSWDKYAQALPGAAYVPPFYDRPLFVRAHAQRAADALASLGKANFDDVALIFTAHSIPQAMADRAPYVEQLRRSAELIARQLAAPSWQIAYQSRSGRPSDPWLEPDIRDALRALAAQGCRDTVVVPVGFLCDHVEVLYDLDIDARAVADAVGIRMARAAALNDHPLFIEMLADLVQQCAA